MTVTLRQRRLNFAPGEEWVYSNSGYVLLKEMVARVTQMPFGDFVRRRLFEPLGMKSSGYLLDASAAGSVPGRCPPSRKLPHVAALWGPRAPDCPHRAHAVIERTLAHLERPTRVPAALSPHAPPCRPALIVGAPRITLTLIGFGGHAGGAPAAMTADVYGAPSRPGAKASAT